MRAAKGTRMWAGVFAVWRIGRTEARFMRDGERRAAVRAAGLCVRRAEPLREGAFAMSLRGVMCLAGIAVVMMLTGCATFANTPAQERTYEAIEKCKAL